MTSPRRLLVLDAAYTLRMVRDRGLEHSVTSRDLDGWFDHVWSVNPLVGADPTEPDRSGPISVVELDARNTVIEAHVARHGWRRGAFVDFALAQIELYRRLSRLVRDERIAAVRVGDPYYLGLFGWALSRRRRIPLVIRINGNNDAIFEAVGALAYPRIFRRRRIEKLVDRFVLPRADLVAGANQDNLDFAIRNGAQPERTTLFRYGALIDPVHYGEPARRPPPAADLGLDGRRFVVYVSRLEPVKLPGDLLDVLALVHERHPDVVLVYVGDGSMRDELASTARARGMQDHVVFAGNRPQDDVARLLAHAAVVLSPMTGRALVEAALAGRPVVAYDVEWHSELLTDGTTGRLVPHRDVAAMAAATTELLDDPQGAAALGAAGRASTMDSMDPASLVAHERAAYATVIGPA